MDFVIAERYGLKYLIIENTYPMECWTLIIRNYSWGFDEWRPPFSMLNGMKIKTVNPKEGIELLRQYATDTVPGHRISEFIERYNALPF